MSERPDPAGGGDRSRIAFEKGPNDLGLNATVSLSRKGMGLTPDTRKGVAPAPPPEAVRSLVYSVATPKEVGCPRCSTEFEITPEFYNAVAECPECSLMFVIKPPGTPPYRGQPPPAVGKTPPLPAGQRWPTPPAPRAAIETPMTTVEMNRNTPLPSAPPVQARTPVAAPSGARTPVTAPSGGRTPVVAPANPQRGVGQTGSGITVEQGANDYGLTATVTLSRRGMSMHQRKKDEAPPPPLVVSSMIYAVATSTDIGCPHCQVRYEISPEFYHAVAECPECSHEFVIKPPGTPPYRAQATPPPPRQVMPVSAHSGPVPVPPGARPARPAAPVPAPAAAPVPVQRTPPASGARPGTAAPPAGGAAPAMPKAGGHAADKSGIKRSSGAPRKTDTHLKPLDELSAPPKPKRQNGRLLLIAGVVLVIILLVVAVALVIKITMVS